MRLKLTRRSTCAVSLGAPVIEKGKESEKDKRADHLRGTHRRVQLAKPLFGAAVRSLHGVEVRPDGSSAPLLPRVR